MRIDEFTNRGFQLGDAAVCTSAQLLVRQLGKPALDEIKPRPIRRREVDMEARALGQPIANQGGFVRSAMTSCSAVTRRAGST